MKLNVKRTIFVGLAFMSISAFWQIYDTIIPLILKDSFNIGDTLAGTVMGIDNMLALFMLPFLGALSDKTTTPIGKRMPFIYVGTFFAVISIILIPISSNRVNFKLFVVALGLVLIAMSTYRSPAVALMPDVTPSPLRSKGNAIINLMGAAGNSVALVAIKFLVPQEDNPNYMVLFIFLALFMAVCIIVQVFTINEPRFIKEAKQQMSDSGIQDEQYEELEQESKVEGLNMPKSIFKSFVFLLASIFLWFMGYNAVITAFSKYATHVWGMKGGDFAGILLTANAAAIVSFIPVGIIASKIGRKKTILIGIGLLGFSFISGILFKDFSNLIYIFFSFAGIGWAFINVNSYPMVVEMGGSGDIGKYTGYYYIVSTAAQTITPTISGFFLEKVGYHTLFPYGAIFVIASFVTMLFVKHGNAKPIASKSILDNFDVDD